MIDKGACILIFYSKHERFMGRIAYTMTFFKTFSLTLGGYLDRLFHTATGLLYEHFCSYSY